MDGVGVRGGGDRKQALRLVRPNEVLKELTGLFERAQHSTQISWMTDRTARHRKVFVSGMESALNRRLCGFRRARLVPTLRPLLSLTDAPRSPVRRSKRDSVGPSQSWM